MCDGRARSLRPVDGALLQVALLDVVHIPAGLICLLRILHGVFVLHCLAITLVVFGSDAVICCFQVQERARHFLFVLLYLWVLHFNVVFHIFIFRFFIVLFLYVLGNDLLVAGLGFEEL